MPGPTPCRSPEEELDEAKALACAQSLAEQGHVEEACRLLSQHLARRPGWARGWNRLGVLRVRLGQPEQAHAAFQQACSADPGYAAPWNNLGNLYSGQGDLARAEQAYRKALALDPRSAPAHGNLAALLRRRGRLAEALRHRRLAARLDGELAPAAPAGAARWLLYLALAAAALGIWAWRGAAAPSPGPSLPDAPPASVREPPARPPPWTPPAGFTENPDADPLEVPLVLQAGRVQLQVRPRELGLVADRRALDLHAVEHLVDRLNQLLALPPTEPRLYVQDDGTVRLVPGRPGRRVDGQAVAEALAQAAGLPGQARLIPVPLVELPPRLNLEDLRPLQHPALLGRYTTRLFPEDPPERATNIELAARELDGVVLPPGAILSFNERVGPRLTERGYREAPVLVGGQFALDVGGGICQVSTTLYNAALLAGLQATSRSPHSIPVPYVSPGRDATVAYGLIDLRLQNPTAYPVALSARLEAGRLSVAVFGPAEMQAPPYRLRSLVEWFVPAGVQEVADPALAPGERVEESPPRSGYGATVWREFTLYGPYSARQRVNVSTYAPRPGRVRVGPSAQAP